MMLQGYVSYHRVGFQREALKEGERKKKKGKTKKKCNLT